MFGLISIEQNPRNYLIFAQASEMASITAEGYIAFELFNEVKSRSDSSETLSGHKQQAVRELKEIINECLVDNWDGAGATRVQGRTAGLAEKFIRALPYGISMPEIVGTEDGLIELDWNPERGRMLSLLIGLDSRFPFAWIDGDDRGHGVVNFDGVRVPSDFLDRLLPIFKR